LKAISKKIAMSDFTISDVMIALGGINTRLDRIDNRLDGIDNRLDGIDNRLDGIDNRLDGIHTEVRILGAKLANSAKGREEVLAIVPKMNGELPTIEYPIIEHLLVAGNERLPSGTANTWNAGKSLSLIREYDPGYETDDTGGETRSRPRRLRVAQLLGITNAQLTFGLLAL
jgi:hypothetical protein